MKRYEKIILIIFALVFALQLLDFPEKNKIFLFSTWLLSLSYLIGGYWLFRQNKEEKAIFVIAGIVFSISIVFFPFLIWINPEPYYKFLPVANGLFCVALGIYLFVKRDSKAILQSYKLIWLRSLVILIVVSFFTYSTAAFKPYRKAIYVLNNGSHIQNNMLMFDYISAYEKALEEENCDQAITYTLKASQAEKLLLRVKAKRERGPEVLEKIVIPSQADSTQLLPELDGLLKELSRHTHVLQTSGSLGNLYKAYKCRGDAHYFQDEYAKALPFYLNADKVLDVYDDSYSDGDSGKEWRLERAASFNLIALCHQRLFNYEYADSFFVKAIEQQQQVMGGTEKGIVVFYKNLAGSMIDQQEYGYANYIYKVAIDVLEEDNGKQENNKQIIEVYHRLVQNYLRTDSLEEAMFFVEQAFSIADKGTLGFCNTNTYYGLCLDRMSKYEEADKVLTACLICNQKLLEAGHQNIAEGHFILGLAKMAIAEYDLAKINLEKGLEITTQNYGEKSVRHANHLKGLADYHKIVANYEQAEQMYLRILEIYQNEFGTKNIVLAKPLSALAHLEITLATFGEAKAHSDLSISIINDTYTLESPQMTGLINNAAYVNYATGRLDISDSLYKKTIRINKKFGVKSATSTAIALNGRGLVMTDRKRYKAANALFSQSLVLHQEIFSDNHPLTALLYLNYAGLKIKTKQLPKAEEMLNKSLAIHKMFFDTDHDIFGDIYAAYGDLYQAQKKHELAGDAYEQALVFYLGKFDYTHPKVILIKKKLQRFQEL